MLIKVFHILQFIATYYNIECLEPKDSEKHNYQEVVPINNYDYVFDSMPIYSTPNPILHTAAELIRIQYAPLEMTDYNNHKHTHAPNRTEAPTIERKPQELEETDNLQPEWFTVEAIDRRHKPRSFFARHDVSELSSNTNVPQAQGLHNIYRTYHTHVDQSKIRNAVYTSFQNPRYGTPEEELLPDGRTILYLPGTQQILPLQERTYIRKLVPFVLRKPFLQGAFARSHGAMQKPAGPKLPKIPREKQQPVIVQPISALSPGLHLNLARVYGIAHTNDQRHIDVPHRNEKPPILNKKSVDKKKIILHSLPQNTQSSDAIF